MLVDLLEQSAPSNPAIDDFLLSFFDDLSSGPLPGTGGMSHASATVVPHNSLSDVVSNSRNNTGMNIETILSEQLLDVTVQVIVVGASCLEIHVVVDVVENSLSVMSVILDHLVDSHHDRSLVVLFDGSFVQATSRLTPVALLSDDHSSPAVVVDFVVLSNILDDPRLNSFHDLDEVRSHVTAVTLGNDPLHVTSDFLLRVLVGPYQVGRQLTDDFVGISVMMLRDDCPDITGN